jgi:hypothetical protein
MWRWKNVRRLVLSIPVMLSALLPLHALAFFQQLQDPDGFIEMDGERFPPANPHEKAEWTFVRFHYDLGAEFGPSGYQRWKADYPKADRQVVQAVRRLTRIQARSTEQIVDAKTDDLYEWPWIYVEDPGAWKISDDEAARLRRYLLRGGSMMIDDSHGNYEWSVAVEGLRKILPLCHIEDLNDGDTIFHMAYDLDDRVQIPGTRYLTGDFHYTPDSSVPRWRAIRDAKGRILIAICHNSDVGDAWEWADSRNYPEHPASVAFRIAANYVLYAMTH